MPNMKSVSLTVQKLRPKLKFFFKQSDRQTESLTGQKLDVPEFHSGGIKTTFLSQHIEALEL